MIIMVKRSRHDATINTPSTTNDGPPPKRSKPSSSSSSAFVTDAQFSPEAFITPWTSSTIITPAQYPPLPEIKDPFLARAALTHSGMRKSSSELSYERLEWIGDAYLELVASELIFSTFPTLPEGQLSHFREMLTCNSTLCQLSIHYGLDKRARFPAEFDLEGRQGGSTASAKRREKALGDIFEAYVGALIRSDPQDGYKTAVDWLKCLWGPALAEHVKAEEQGKSGSLVGQKIPPKTKLEQMLVVPGVKLKYRDLPGDKKDHMGHQLFVVGVFLNGWGEENVQLGFGSARGKKEAGQKAAQMAMENKKLMKKYSQRRQAFLAARTKQKGEAGRAGEDLEEGEIKE